MKQAFQWYQSYYNWTATATEKIVYFSYFKFFIFYKLFCHISQNKPCQHKIPFVVMCHKCDLSQQMYLMSVWLLLRYVAKQDLKIQTKLQRK